MNLSFLVLTACAGAPDLGPVPAVPTAPTAPIVAPAPIAGPVAAPIASPSVSSTVGGCNSCSSGVTYAPPAHKGLFSHFKDKFNCWPTGPMFPAGTAPIVYVQPKNHNDCGHGGCWKPGSLIHKCLSKFSLGCNKCDGAFHSGSCNTCGTKPACTTCEKPSCFNCNSWKNCFGFCNKSSACTTGHTGCVGGCGTGHGSIVSAPAAGGCGSTVIPPGTTVPVAPPAKDLPKVDPKPVEPKKIPEKMMTPSRSPIIPSSSRSPIEVVSPF